MTTALPHRPFLPSPRLPRYGQMKTMQFWLFHHRHRYPVTGQENAAATSDVSALSNPPPFPPIFGLRGGEMAINQISEDSFSCWRGSADQRLHTCCYTPCSPYLPTNHHPNLHEFSFSTFSGSNNSTTPILSWLILWIISTRVYVNLIRERSDIDTEITFISHTMINLKGIKVGRSLHPQQKKTRDF